MAARGVGGRAASFGLADSMAVMTARMSSRPVQARVVLVRRGYRSMVASMISLWQAGWWQSLRGPSIGRALQLVARERRIAPFVLIVLIRKVPLVLIRKVLSCAGRGGGSQRQFPTQSFA